MVWVGWINLAALSAYATLSPIAAWMVWSKGHRISAAWVAAAGLGAAALAIVHAKVALG